jgi:ATP-dependent protease Clp ATPase subunit
LLLIAVGGSREGLAKDVLNRIVQKAIGWKENKTARDKEKEMEGEIP